MRRSLALAAGLMSVNLLAHAEGIGTSVTGSVFYGDNPVNYFDPANGGSAAYGNSAGSTVTIGPGIEFGYSDYFNTDTANFTGSTLSISDVDRGTALPFEMIFTDSAFTGFSEISGTAQGYTFTFSGDTLDVFYAGISNPGTFDSNFSYATTAATPEPSSIALFGSGLIGGIVRRRRCDRRDVAVENSTGTRDHSPLSITSAKLVAFHPRPTSG